MIPDAFKTLAKMAITFGVKYADGFSFKRSEFGHNKKATCFFKKANYLIL